MLSRKWADRFMDVARLLATWSKDPSIQVGAVVVDAERRVIGTGYNGFPRGVHDLQERYENRELKYPMIVHAEENALLTAVKEVRGCILVTMRFPCTECAKPIIQLGISRVIYDGELDGPSHEKWIADQKIAASMLMEAGVRVHQLSKIGPGIPTNGRHG